MILTQHKIKIIIVPPHWVSSFFSSLVLLFFRRNKKRSAGGGVFSGFMYSYMKVLSWSDLAFLFVTFQVLILFSVLKYSYAVSQKSYSKGKLFCILVVNILRNKMRIFFHLVKFTSIAMS